MWEFMGKLCWKTRHAFVLILWMFLIKKGHCLHALSFWILPCSVFHCVSWLGKYYCYRRAFKLKQGFFLRSKSFADGRIPYPQVVGSLNSCYKVNMGINKLKLLQLCNQLKCFLVLSFAYHWRFIIIDYFIIICRGPEFSIFVGDLTPDVNDFMLQVWSLL